ncbi:hypothetical protein WA588_004888 [Blastocystis sp. NMH]
MDFDKQFGSVASAPVVKRGRGFTEKPMAQRNPMPRQNTVRSTQQKVTPKTTFVVTNNRPFQRGPMNGMNGRAPFYQGRGNGYQRGNQRGFNHYDGRRSSFRRNGRPMGRGPRRGGNGNHGRKPLTESQLDAQLDKYFEKDPEVMNQKLDADLDAYMQRGDVPVQPIDAVATQAAEN